MAAFKAKYCMLAKVVCKYAVLICFQRCHGVYGCTRNFILMVHTKRSLPTHAPIEKGFTLYNTRGMTYVLAKTPS